VLDRSLGTAGVLFLTLSVTTPASSVFVIVPGMVQVAGSGALIAMLLAGLVCLATALIYAELSSVWPDAGGEYVMVAHTLGPAAGFAMLGVNMFNNLLFPPVAVLGIAAVLATVWPALPPVPVAVGVMAMATLIGILDIRVNAIVTGAFLVIEVAALAVVAALGFGQPVRDVGAALLHPVVVASGALVPASWGQIGLATSIAIFALNGYGAAVYFAKEMRDAPTRIARAILVTLAATLVLEAVPLVAGLAGAPDLAAFLTSDDPFGALVSELGGRTLGGWVAIGIVVAIVNAVIAGILATARFFYATARDGSWGRPVDRWLAALHPRTASPVAATLASGAIGIACCFVPLRLLLVLSGAGLVAIYAGMTLAVVAGRRSGATAHAAYRMPLYPLAPLAAAAMLIAVATLNWLDVGEGRFALIATLAQIGLSLAYYHLVLRRRSWSP
jgi:amino acid transporter